MNIYTPDEQLHRQHAAQQQRDRFIMRALAVAPKDRKQFAHDVETDIIDRLRAENHIPFERVAGLTHIEICNDDPTRYAGWMAA